MATKKFSTQCKDCDRLAGFLAESKQKYPDYFCQPVPPFGDDNAKLLVVGLAPGLHGANRTGRAFVGDASGRFLFEALAATAFASSADPGAARLQNMTITNVVKCLPPGNQVIAAERHNCQDYLQDELLALWSPKTRRPRVVLALGGVAWAATCRALNQLSGGLGMATADAPFAHGQMQRLAPDLTLVGSYHPSRQNVNTGRLNQAMLQDVLHKVRRIIMAL